MAYEGIFIEDPLLYKIPIYTLEITKLMKKSACQQNIRIFPLRYQYLSCSSNHWNRSSLFKSCLLDIQIYLYSDPTRRSLWSSA